MIFTNDQREKMAQFVRSYLLRTAELHGHKNADFRASARWTHTLNVVKNTHAICEQEGVSEYTHLVAEIAALFHDVDHYTVQPEYHAVRGAETATRYLTKEEFPADIVRAVATAVQNHQLDLDDDIEVEELVSQIVATRDYESRILIDADILDKLGATNILQSMLSMCRQQTKLADTARELTTGWPLQRAYLWKQLLTTPTGQLLGEQRYAFHQAFLVQLEQEFVLHDPYQDMTITQQMRTIQI